MSWVKKGPVLGTLAAALLLWAFVFFFFDPILKQGLIAGGQVAAGAKVEIGSVRSKWLKGTLEINRVAVADHGAPMKNLVELSRLSFQLDTSIQEGAEVLALLDEVTRNDHEPKP